MDALFTLVCNQSIAYQNIFKHSIYITCIITVTAKHKTLSKDTYMTLIGFSCTSICIFYLQYSSLVPLNEEINNCLTSSSSLKTSIQTEKNPFAKASFIVKSK